MVLVLFTQLLSHTFKSWGESVAQSKRTRSRKPRLTLSLPQPVTFPGWKLYTNTPANSIFWWSYEKSTFNAVHFGRNPLTCSGEGGKKPECFQIWRFYWSFSEWRRGIHGSERVKHDGAWSPNEWVTVTCQALFCASPEIFSGVKFCADSAKVLPDETINRVTVCP